MSKLFAFVPAAQFRADITETLIRIGHSKTGLKRFTGMNEPKTVLMCIDVSDGQEASYKLKQILRGNDPYTRQGSEDGMCWFDLHADFRPSVAGDNYFVTKFKTPRLKELFEKIELMFKPEEER